MSTPSTLTPLPRHWPQSDSSTTSAVPKSGTLVFQLALGAFVGLVQRFVEYHLGFGWLRPGFLSVHSILPALDGVFGAFGSTWPGLDPLPPIQLADSGLSHIETPLQADASSLALNHIRRMSSTLDGGLEFDEHTHDATYAYALLVCVIVAIFAGVWLLLRRSARLENAFSTSAATPTGSGENESNVHNGLGEKRNAQKQGRGSSRREGFGSNESPKGDPASDLSEDDDDDDDDDPPPPPPGSSSQFLDDDEGQGKLWTVVGGNLILGSIVVGMWKVMRWLRWATTRRGKRGLDGRSFGETIGMEKYENEWDVLTGSYRSSPSISSSTTKPSTLRHAVSMPTILSVGPSLLAPSAVAAPYLSLQEKLPVSIGLSANASQGEARKNSTARSENHLETGLQRYQGRRANVGTMAKKKRRARNMKVDVSKLKVRLRNLIHEFVETFGLMALAVLFAFPLVIAYLGLEFGGDDEDSDAARQESEANGGPHFVEVASEDVGNIAAKGSDKDGVEVEGCDVSEPGQPLEEANASLEVSRKRDEEDEDGFVYLNERVCATFHPYTPTLHYIPEMVKPADGPPLDEGCDTLVVRPSMVLVNEREVSPSETSNLDDHARDISTTEVAGDDDEIEMIGSLIQMVFQYHDQVNDEDRLESKVETDVAEPQGEDRQGDDELEEDDWLSEVGSYVTAEDSEVDIRMDVDEVDLVYEELESWPEQVHHQSSLETSELTNLYVLYSDRENIRYVNDSTTEVDADDPAQLFPGSFPKPRVAVPLWSAHNCWTFTQPTSPSDNLHEREGESLLPSDAVTFGLPRSGLNVEPTSTMQDIVSGSVYLTPPRVNNKVFPGSPPAVPRGRKLRLREKLMREKERENDQRVGESVVTMLMIGELMDVRA